MGGGVGLGLQQEDEEEEEEEVGELRRWRRELFPGQAVVSDCCHGKSYTLLY